MWINLIVLLFVVGVAYFYSTQGLFSALLHLVLLIVAGALGLAAWEPLAVNLLIERMPEYAWGVGLLAPFFLILLVLRIASDRFLLGNLDANYLLNGLGGGVVGFVIGILTAGYLVIGLQFVGSVSLVGYKPYALNEQGQVVRNQSLWLKCDDITSGVYRMLSGGAFHPFGGETLGRYQPDLARAAGLYHLTARRIGRQSIRPASIEVRDIHSLDQPAAEARLKPDQLKIDPTQQVLLIGTRILNPAADRDGIFTASRAQVALLHGDKGPSTVTHPVGYLQYRNYGSFTAPGAFARSSSGASEEVFHWVFVIPAEHHPRHLRFKQLRLAIPEIEFSPQKTTELRDLLQGTNWNPQPASTDDTSDGGGVQRIEHPAHGMPGGAEGVSVEVDDVLPFALSRNHLAMAGGETDPNGLISAHGRFERYSARGERLRVERISHDANATAIVQVQVEARQAKSLLGKAVASATNLQRPVLVDNDGRTYGWIGYVRVEKGFLRLHLDTTAGGGPRSLQEAEIHNLESNHKLILFFRVGRPKHITAMKIGNTTVDLNVQVR